MRSKNVPASLRGSCKTFPLFPSGGKVVRETPRFLAGARAEQSRKAIAEGRSFRILVCGSFEVAHRTLEDRSARMPIMRRQLSTAKRTVNPGGCLLSEEGLVCVFADAGLKFGWQVRRRQAARVARPPLAASGLTPPPPPSRRPPSHQCRFLRKRIQTTQNAS